MYKKFNSSTVGSRVMGWTWLEWLQWYLRNMINKTKKFWIYCVESSFDRPALLLELRSVEIFVLLL